MGVIQIHDIFNIIRKHFVRIVAACLAVGVLAYAITSLTQSYTCTLNFKYNYPAAEQGFAPDGESELDPYELENPAVIQAAIASLGLDPEGEQLSVEGIRSDMRISTVIPTLDQEVTESAAVQGQKYEVPIVEYQLTYSYDADLGMDFGPRMFDGIIKSYDDFVISKYYNKEHIPDFMKALEGVKVDYLESADIIESRLSDIISYLNDMSEWYPDFRSVRTGYTFADVSALYQNMVEVHHAKYEGNIRAGNLSKDNELTIKNYTAKVKDLKVDSEINSGIAENYKSEISSFYNSYKEAGLYNQANSVQVSTDSSNNRDQEIFRDYEHDFDLLKNTYDKIVTNYTISASNASSADWEIDHLNAIIDDFSTDNVSESTKDRLLAVNEDILGQMSVLSAVYSSLANEVIDEFFSDRVSTEIQYLISTDISEDRSPLLFTVFAVFVFGALLLIAIIVIELIRRNNAAETTETAAPLDMDHLDREHQIAYEQYKKGFDEFYMLYQPMVNCRTNNRTHFEAFIRWENEELGNVSPGMILDYFSDLKLLKALNNWIFTSVCKDIPRFTRALTGKIPVIHVNCLYSEIEDFGLNEMLMENIKRFNVNPASLCIELDGDGIVSCLEDVMSLKDMGMPICVDHFEAKESENEILQVIEPEYVKMSSDVFASYDLATSEQDMYYASLNTATYFTEIIEKCNKQDIAVCICGIENKMQNEIISRLGFRFKQGYYFGHPMRVADCLKSLHEGDI